jgi:hypothetical protein
MNTKIVVVLVMAIAVVGLTGAASASLYDDYMARGSGYSFDSSSYYPSVGSYAHTSIDYSSISNGVTSSVSEDFYGSHTCDFSESSITTHTDITVYQSPSMFDSYVPSYEPSYTSSPSIFDSYVPTYSFWP